MTNQLKNLIILFIFLLSACNTSESFTATYQSRLRIIERQDHQTCVAQGMDYGDWDEITTEMYWRCRYNLVMDRKINLAITAESIQNNAIVEKISEEMLKNLNRAKYSALAKIEEDIELSDHNKCVGKGINLKLGELNDDYYRCRQTLVVARIPPAPKVTNAFESAILSKDQDENLRIATESRNSNREAIRVAMVMQQYPNCIGLNIESDDFKKCSAAWDQSKQCLGTISSLRVKKELQDKIYCQQQAFVQFPDNYALAKDKSSSEIERLKTQAKKNKNNEETQKEINTALLYLEGNKNVVENIGREVEDSGDDEKKGKERIYNRVELLKLREQFIYQCDKKMEEKLPDFAQKTAEECMNIARGWDK